MSKNPKELEDKGKSILFQTTAKLIYLALSALFLLLFWNWLMPIFFGLITINYWQSVGILLMSNIILKFDIEGGWDDD